MRLKRLDFLAWGPFEKTSVPFDDAAKLEVIFGPNERGKSSALRGVKALLFGIPVRTADNHRFDNSDLRIGAQIVSDKNELVEVVRRKAQKKTLLRPDGTAFDNDVLVPGYSEEEFGHLFGFDHETLRKSGEELTKGKGAFASTLWAATTGYLGAQRLLETLSEEASNIFAPLKRSTVLSKLLDDHQAATKRASESVTTPEAYKTQVAAIAQVDERLSEQKAEEAALETDRRRVQFRLDVVESKARLRTLDEQLAPMADVPMINQAQLERIVARYEAYELALRELHVVEAARSAIVNEVADLGDSPPIVGREQDIARLIEQRAVALGAKDKLESLSATLSRLAREEASVSEGLPPEVASRAACVTKSASARAIAMTEEAHANARARELLSADRDRIQADLKLASVNHDEVDFATRSALEESTELLVEAKALRDLRTSVATLSAKLADQLNALGISSTPSASLPPSKAEADRWVLEHQQRSGALSALRQAALACKSTLEETQRSLASLERLVPAAATDALGVARAARDNAWAAFRSAGGREADFIAAATAVDKLVDDMLAASDALAEAKHLRRALVEKGKALDDAERAVAVAENDHRSAHSEVALRFKVWGIAPSNAYEASAWAEQLREVAKNKERLTEVASALQATEASFNARFERVARALKLDERVDVERATVLVDCAKKQLSAADQRAGELREIEARAKLATARAEAINREAAELVARENKTKAEIEELLGSLGIRTSDVPRALAAIPLAERLAFLQASKASMEDERRRLVSLVESFEQAAVELASALGFPASVTSLDNMSTVLRAEVARETRRGYLRGKCNELSGDRAVCEATVTRAREMLEREATDVGMPTIDSFLRIRDRLPAAVALRSQREREQALLSEREALEPEFARESRQVSESASELRAEQGRIVEALAASRAKREEWLAERVSLRLGLERFDRGSSAAEFALEANILSAEIGEQARQYARLRAAQLLLRVSIERNQKEYESPVLTRANGILALLTRGAYEGMRVELGDKGEPELKAIGRDQRPKSAASLSEGTRNQMFLALKLASVEQACRERTPLPLVLDDVLVHFDDERSEATLETLAELSRVTQVLLFTHHRRIADFASRLHRASVREL